MPTNTSVLSGLKNRLQSLAAFVNPGREVAQQRGRDFEALLLDLFAAHELLLRRSYHTADNRSEQIDGAIEILGRVALVEAKWVKSSLAASELFAFLGKIEGKFVGTIGLFISYHELSANFINALRSGRRQSILAIHGKDEVERIFEPDFKVREYLEAYLRRVATDNIAEFPPTSFVAEQRSVQRANESEQKKGIRELLTSLADPGASAQGIAISDDIAQLADHIKALLDYYPRILTVSSSPFLRSQVLKYLEAAVPRLQDAELELDRSFFGDVLVRKLFDPAYTPLIATFATRIPALSETALETVETVLLLEWKNNFGIYEKENALASVTKPLWRYLSPATKQALMDYFISIVNSDRQTRFPQVQLAQEILSAPENAALRNQVLQDSILKEAQTLLKYPDEDVESVKKMIRRSFANVLGFVPDEIALQAIEAIASLDQQTG